ncbi:MAG TPA: serine/threonine-protein kinase [Gemmataceae bacterium]|nr:serine/threonine-protein kinase [Gemmataceae bacterium]
MLVGQQFGPFTIDRELGSGAMGTVYRGRYTKTGQLMAIKIMAPGIGSTNAAAADRFEREITVLKQLNHPNIVRFYGAGKHQRNRYFAMEFIDGESLDKIMSRRGRMTWEEVAELGKQLCSALQHAHDQGIIHRDLKPSNIMMLSDGTLKLTDFGIAKDIDLDALTATNCTVGTAAYMSPEQCKGMSDLTLKSDLYSLGVLFYELVTGRKPFKADNAMDMFMQHVNGTFERPSRLVLDIPVWLDTLICQLLEKKPEQRPLDANMVANTLGTIQEKIEAQQSAGVEVVRRRLMDRTTSQKRVDEEDKEAARVLMTGKGRSKRKRGKKPLYQKVWFQAAGLSLALVFVATLLYLLFRPPSADKLYQKARAAAQSDNVEEQEKAIEPNGAIYKYIDLYGDEDNEQAREVRGWRTRIQMAHHERLLNNYMQKRKGPIKVEAQSKTEEKAFAAMEADEKGNHDAAVEHWNAVKTLGGEGSSWARVADKHLAEWKAADQMNDTFSRMYDDIKSPEEEPPYKNKHQRLAFLAWLAENCKTGVGDKGLAKSLLQSLREDAAKEGGARNRWYLYAAWKIPTLGDDDLNKDKLRDKVQERLDEVREQLAQGKTTQTKARIVYRDVLILYGQDKAMEGVVNEAREFLKGKKE